MNKYIIVFFVLATVLLALFSMHFEVTVFQMMFGYLIILFIVATAFFAYLSNDEG